MLVQEAVQGITLLVELGLKLAILQLLQKISPQPLLLLFSLPVLGHPQGHDGLVAVHDLVLDGFHLLAYPEMLFRVFAPVGSLPQSLHSWESALELIDQQRVALDAVLVALMIVAITVSRLLLLRSSLGRLPLGCCVYHQLVGDLASLRHFGWVSLLLDCD